VPITLAERPRMRTVEGQFPLKRLQYKIGEGQWSDTDTWPTRSSSDSVSSYPVEQEIRMNPSSRRDPRGIDRRPARRRRARDLHRRPAPHAAHVRGDAPRLLDAARPLQQDHRQDHARHRGEEGSADIAMETASVSSGIDKLDEHLRSEDFLGAAKNPTITFKSTDFTFDGDKVKSARGDLTLNGITRPVTFTANVFLCGPHPMTKKKQCGADLQATIKRSDFGMKYALPALGDEVTLRVPVEATLD
jgi:hypothetical protein